MTSPQEAMPDVGPMNESEAPSSLPTIVVQDGSPEKLLHAVEVIRRSLSLEAATATPPAAIQAPGAVDIILSLAEVAVESMKALHVGGAAGTVATTLDVFLDLTDAAAADVPHAVFRALELLAQLVEAETQQGHPAIAALAAHIRAVVEKLQA